jgi:hypothetical protein
LRGIRRRWQTSAQVISAIKFLFGRVLHKPAVIGELPRSRREHKLPIVLSRSQVLHIFNAISNPLDIDTRIIGYFAYVPPVYAVCDNDACVITGSKAATQRYIASLEPDVSRYSQIKKTRLGEIMQGIRWGAAYAFDEPSYRFYLEPYAKGRFSC